MNTEWCVLIPAWRPAFRNLDRLVGEAKHLSSDFASVRVFTVLTDLSEQQDFTRQFLTSSEQLSFLTLDKLLLDRRWSVDKLDNVTKLEAEIATVSKHWEPRRVLQAVKKFLGLEAIYRDHSCELAWVLDSESAPLRRFSFVQTFLEYQHAPRILVTNLSDPSVTNSARAARLTSNAAKGLGLDTDTGKYSISYRSTDFWMFSLPDISQLMVMVAEHHNITFLEAFIRSPAGVPVYYGVYLRHARQYTKMKTEIVVFPQLLKHQGINPSEGTKLNPEVARDLFRCEEEGPWTDVHREMILNGPLSWIKGWRVDHLPVGGCGSQNSSAQVLVQNSPSVIWATSNYAYQVQRIST
jgi:hypothetical protein